MGYSPRPFVPQKGLSGAGLPRESFEHRRFRGAGAVGRGWMEARARNIAGRKCARAPAWDNRAISRPVPPVPLHGVLVLYQWLMSMDIRARPMSCPVPPSARGARKNGRRRKRARLYLGTVPVPCRGPLGRRQRVPIGSRFAPRRCGRSGQVVSVFAVVIAIAENAVCNRAVETLLRVVRSD